MQGQLSPVLGIAEMNGGFVSAWWQGNGTPCRIDPSPQGAAALSDPKLRPEELEGRGAPPLDARAVRLAVGAGLVQQESRDQLLSRARAAEICRRVQL